MIELKHRFSCDVRYRSETAKTREEAILEAIKKKNDLSDCDLSGCDLSDCDLSGSNLRGSNLRGSDLSGSDLRGSNLSGSDLRGSDLSGSDLRGSDLRGSDLRGSDLSGSDLRGSNLIDVGQTLRGYQFFGYWRNGIRVKAGCRDYSLSEAKTHWADAPEELAKVNLIEITAVIRNWEVIFNQPKEEALKAA